MKLKSILLLKFAKENEWVKSATSGSISIASFATVIRAPVEITSANFSFAFSLTTRIVKKIIKNNTK